MTTTPPIRRGYIVIITKPEDDRLYGPVELSFSLDVRENEAFRYWDIPDSKRDAITWANQDIKMWRGDNPTWVFKIWSVNDPLLPVIIDWKKWDWAIEPDKDKLSGIRDKYHARNLLICKKNAHDRAADVAAVLGGASDPTI